MYETFEHTADLGLRVRAADLNTLFAEAGEALSSALVDDLDAIRPDRPVTFHVEDEDREYLLFDWLRELLYQFESQGMLFRRFEAAVTNASLDATAWGESYDPVRHALAHEVKAITYHGLKVEPDGDGWLAEVIVDI